MPPPGLSSRGGVSIFFSSPRRPVINSSFLLVITLNLDPGSVEPVVETADEPIDSVTLDVYGEDTDPVEGVDESDCTSPVREVCHLSNPFTVPAQPRHIIDRDRTYLLINRPVPRLERDDSVV